MTDSVSRLFTFSFPRAAQTTESLNVVYATSFGGGLRSTIAKYGSIHAGNFHVKRGCEHNY